MFALPPPLASALGRLGAVLLLVFAITLLAAAMYVYRCNAAHTIERLLDARPALSSTHVCSAGVRPLLRDLSTISPALVAVTAIQLLLGAMRLLGLGRAELLAGERFPFHRSYKIYYVQLGLIGTVIGFVLAFSAIDLNAGEQADTQILLDALGTALWSTLSALSLAYVFCPAAEQIYQQLAKARAGTPARADPAAAVARLTAEVVSAADALHALCASANACASGLELHDVNVKLGQLEIRLNHIAESLARVTALTEDMVHGVDQLQAARGHHETRLDAVEAQTRRLDERTSGVAETLRNAFTRLDKV
ncbi:MAG: hypothetical protein GKR94_34560 [Gammaproteobacteria bacterium]|nr:hypothetical protein [Gammaproteobacteria bacterium]